MKKAITILWLLTIFSGMACILWYADWQYSLPTPVPKQYRTVSTGTAIDLDGKLAIPGNKPVFIHFFNPDCPCSRFNIPYFKSLAKKYRDKISFAIVVMNNSEYGVKDIQNKFDVDFPVAFDSSIAAACGVYSTPQAVLLDATRHLYYRGNYNKGRYCTDPGSNSFKFFFPCFINKDFRCRLFGLRLTVFVGNKTPAMHIIDVSVAIVINAVSCNFLFIGPNKVFQFFVRGINAIIYNGNNNRLGFSTL